MMSYIMVQILAVLIIFCANGVFKVISKSEQYCFDLYSRNVSEEEDLHYDMTAPLCMPKEFPHMAAIGFGNETNKLWKCGGSLISPEFVLTAAHCLHSIDWGPATWVRLGDLNLISAEEEEEPQDFNIKKVYRHPEYKSHSYYHDIALIKLHEPATLTAYVKPACLYNSKKIPKCFLPAATGWGNVEFLGEMTYHLLKVYLEHFSNAECRKNYRITPRLKYGVLDDIQLCAGGKSEPRDTCQGDSGGPLQIPGLNNKVPHHAIIGITSFGKGCGIVNVPGVYTRVSYYVPWIESIVWK